jgi:lipopolysaccharide/colanic/teichoic acid biosynthesis glycosyltransferase
MSEGEQLLKRAIDVAGALVMLVQSAPLMVSLALLIKMDDKGPVLYRRRVVGMNGEFDAFKFRTMRVDADEVLHRDAKLREKFQANFKLKNDPRVTSVGKFMRRLSLDELPQLWNVIKGEMSLVGPRMISPAEIEKYGDAAWIFTVMKPGLSGYWQVDGKRDGTYDERVAMDLEYVKRWSLLWDLKIILMTPVRVLRGTGND